MARQPSALDTAAGGSTAVFRTATDFARMVSAGRDALGRYESLQAEVTEAHKLMAKEASEKVAEVLRTRIEEHGREQRETHYLIDSILDPEYQTATLDGFVLGGVQLDRSPARAYYRNLEGGSDVFLGRKISGFFRGEGGDVGPSANRIDRQLIQIGRSFGSRPGNRGTAGNPIPVESLINQRTGKLRVRKAARAPGETNALGGKDQPNNFGYRIVIRNPIPAYEYFLQGGLKWLESDSAERIYSRVLAGTGAKVAGKVV